MIALLAMISLLAFLWVLAAILNNSEITYKEPCTRHTWVYKPIDQLNPELGTYLVCIDCKQLPNGDFEE